VRQQTERTTKATALLPRHYFIPITCESVITTSTPHTKKKSVADTPDAFYCNEREKRGAPSRGGQDCSQIRNYNSSKCILYLDIVWAFDSTPSDLGNATLLNRRVGHRGTQLPGAETTIMAAPVVPFERL